MTKEQIRAAAINAANEVYNREEQVRVLGAMSNGYAMFEHFLKEE